MSNRKSGAKQAAKVRGARVQLNGQAGTHANGDGQAKKQAPPIPDITANKVKRGCTTYLWHRRLAYGKPTLLFGEAGAGKSTLATAIAAHLTRGEALPGGPHVEACHVAIWTAEEGVAEDWLARLKLAGADMRRVHFPGVDETGFVKERLQLPLDQQRMGDYLVKARIRLAILDPVGSCLVDGMDENHATTARPVMQALIDATRPAGCGSIAIKHPNKREGGSALGRVSGSMEWVNVPRFVMLVGETRNDQETRLLASLKPSPPGRPPSLSGRIDIVKNVSRWTFAGESALTADDVLTGPDDPVEKSALVEAKAFITSLMDSGEDKATAITTALEAVGISRSTWKRAKKELDIESAERYDGPTRFWVWIKPAAGWPKPPASQGLKP